MKQDVIDWSEGRAPSKRVSKETLNHPELIELVSGLDVYRRTQEAYLAAYQALGIDLINRVPLENAPPPTPKGERRAHRDKPYTLTALGVYDTAFRVKPLCSNLDELWNLDVAALRYEDLVVPAPHPCAGDDIAHRQQALGEVGLYYPMLYTTLFMWAVEFLGWELFMMAATLEPDRFHDHFLAPCAEKSRRIVDEITRSSESPFIFLHDDLADARGPVFPPSWYDDYIFPHYRTIFEPARRRGKRIILVADGNMTPFFPNLIAAGVDGLMCENPATDLDSALEHFGAPGRFLIGGIETAVLAHGSPEDVRKMVARVAEKTRNVAGFALSSCGGLHGDIPLGNLEAYFDARVEIGATPENWRSRCRA